MANELVEQATPVIPDKVLQTMNPKNLGPMAKEILRTEGNLMGLSTRGYKEMAERLRSQREQLEEEQKLREAMGDLERAEDATKLIRDQQREIDGLQRRLQGKAKSDTAAIARPAAAIDAKSTR